MKQLSYLFVLLPPLPGAMAPGQEQGGLSFWGWGSAGTAHLLSCPLAPGSAAQPGINSLSSPLFLPGTSESGGEYGLACTLRHSLKLTRFPPNVGDSARRRTKVSAVVWNLINTKLQKHTPGLNAFPSHPPLGQQEQFSLQWNMGQCALLAQWGGFSAHISSRVLLLLFKNGVCSRTMLLLEFKRKGI